MGKMFKVVTLYLFVAIMGLLVGNISKRQPNVNENFQDYAYAVVRSDGVDDVLEAADLIVEATIRDIASEKQYVTYDTEVNKVLKGEYDDEYLKISSRLSFYSFEYQNETYSGVTNTEYQEGKKYIFVLQHIDNIYDEKYLLLSDMYIPVSEVEKATILSMPLKVDTNIVSYIEDFTRINVNSKGKDLCIPYTDAMDLEEIVPYSEYIIEIEVKEKILTNENRDVYTCKVKNWIKGNGNMTEENEIYVVFFQNTVTTNQEYILLLNSDTDTSMLYTLSSKNSIHSTDKKQTILNNMVEIKSNE